MATNGGTPADVVARLRAMCVALPESYEERAWVGLRWRVRTKTFAHVLTIADGWPPVYARALGSDALSTVLMFRAVGTDLDVLRNAGHPFFAPPWRADEVGLVLDDAVDWSQIAELLTDSYCAQAPKKLAAQVGRPPA